CCTPAKGESPVSHCLTKVAMLSRSAAVIKLKTSCEKKASLTSRKPRAPSKEPSCEVPNPVSSRKSFSYTPRSVAALKYCTVKSKFVVRCEPLKSVPAAKFAWWQVTHFKLLWISV